MGEHGGYVNKRESTYGRGAPRAHAHHALPDHETLRGVPLEQRRAPGTPRDSPCDSRVDDRRGRRNDPTRGTKGRRR